MELSLIVESKNFEHNKEMQSEIEKNPCKLCLMGSGPMCVERKYCRWDTHREIYVKKEVRVNE